MMYIALLLLFFVKAASAQESNGCPAELKPLKLSAVAVWVRSFSNDTSQYRISDEDLSVRGYERMAPDKVDGVAMLARHPQDCVLPRCSIRLTAFQQTNGALLHMDNSLVANRADYENVEDDFYCAKSRGDCGADVPVFRLVKHSLQGPQYAYTLNGETMSGYEKEFAPICFAWTSAPSLLLFNSSSESVCYALKSKTNGKITYSTDYATSIFSIGTTASLQCDEDFVGTGQSSLLCTQSGWHPSVGLGSCMPRKAAASPSFLSSGSVDSPRDESGCLAPSTVPNGVVVYSQIPVNGTVAESSRAIVSCNLGFLATSQAASSCDYGSWTPSFPKCFPLLGYSCAILGDPQHGEVLMEKKEFVRFVQLQLIFDERIASPYKKGSIVRLKCARGFSPSGNTSASCLSSGWSNSLGECLPISSGPGCTQLEVTHGSVTYAQANPTSPYASGTTAFILCEPGFLPQGSPSALCLNGVWSPAIGQCTTVSLSVGGLNTGNSGATCPDLTSPINGAVTYSPASAQFGSHTSGTVATLNCNSGSVVSGGSLSSTCSNGVWSPPTLGTCSQATGPVDNTIIGGPLGETSNGMQCPNPVVPEGQLTYTQSSPSEPQKPSGTIVTFTCGDGSMVSGSSTSTCQNGVWSPTLGTCTSLGSSTMTTGAFGSSVQCLALMAPPGGNVTYTPQVASVFGPYNSGTVANLQCAQGTVQGSSTSTCQNGQWIPMSLGTCSQDSGLGSSTNLNNGAQCFAMLPPIEGEILYSTGPSLGPFPSGSSATLSCRNGLVVQGSSTSTCQNGVWQPPLVGPCAQSSGTLNGSVGSDQCSALPAPSGAQVSYSNGNTGSFAAGVIATVTCTQNGAILGTPACMGGIWTPQIGGSCEGNNDIGGLPTTDSPDRTRRQTASCLIGMLAPLGGEVSYSNGQPFGPYPAATVATAICTNSQPLSGVASASCLNGAWQPPSFGTCGGSLGTIPGFPGAGAGQCAALLPPLGATVAYSPAGTTMYNNGATATVTCSTGTPLGVATCQNGLWTPPITGSCSGQPGLGSGLQCSSPVPALGATISYSDGQALTHISGTKATIFCAGSTVSGSTTSTCQNGQWIPALGTCTGLNNPGSTGQQCFVPPVTPLGASVTYSTTSYLAPWPAGTSATLMCPAGQVVAGTTTTTCQGSQWVPAFGLCQPIGGVGLGSGCSPLGAIASSVVNGQMTYAPALTTSVALGTVASVSCFPGYRLQGPPTATCTSSGWSPLTLGTCFQQQGPTPSCGSLLPVTDGSISYSSEAAGPTFPNGAVAVLSCSTGFLVSGTSSVTCLNQVWTPGALGRCVRSGTQGVPGSACLSGLPAVLNGAVAYSNGQPLGPYPAGTVATATCNLGTTPLGEMSTSCINGQWLPTTLGTCSIVGSTLPGGVDPLVPGSALPCGAVATPLFGTISYSNIGVTYPSGSVATLVCSLGMFPQGQTTATCANGIWSPALGTCGGSPLLRVSDPKNQSIEAKLEKAKQEAGSTALGIEYDVPRADTCRSLIAPAFGEITFSRKSEHGAFELGTTAALRCSLGYEASGPTFSTCKKGFFRPPLGKCLGGKEPFSGICVPLTPPRNGRITYIQSGRSLDFEDGTTALLYCEEGFLVTGTATLQCHAGGWEPAAGFGTCDEISSS
ncbi:unnamed protein product [Caenorhabditis auriculariae]|uniref:Sushi domain-containing protein n=1 Tax=Caenorhabditis auriculariae TaxID=2777116 RepID=A0A8S1GMH8_9PELO|nr:unnamed protein product [Caenorhabditis auriculariae]